MFKKSVSIALAAAQILMTAPAFSAELAPSSTVSTPELTLVEGTLALTGENLSKEKLQAGVVELLKQYNAAATPDGSQQRLRDAFVQLQLYTPAQADAMVAKLATSERKLLSENFSSKDAETRAMTQEIGSMLGTNAPGAQFSLCGAAMVTDIVLVVGGGLALWASAADYLDAMNNGGFSDPGYKTRNEELAIYGAAGLAVGVGLYFILAGNHKC